MKSTSLLLGVVASVWIASARAADAVAAEAEKAEPPERERGEHFPCGVGEVAVRQIEPRDPVRVEVGEHQVIDAADIVPVKLGGYLGGRVYQQVNIMKKGGRPAP